MKAKIMVSIALAVTLSGCTTYGYIEPKPSSDSSCKQESGYIQSNPSIKSTQQNFVEVVAPKTFESGGRMRFFVQVGNGSNESFDFSPGDLWAFKRGEIGQVQLHVYTYEELLEEEQTRQNWQALAVGLTGAVNGIAAANAGYSYSTGSYSGTYSGNNIGGVYSGSYIQQTYNPYLAQMAQQQAQAQTQSQIQALSEQSAHAMRQLGNSILQMNTVGIGQFCGGQIEIDAPDVQHYPDQSLLLRVKAGEEIHWFRFNAKRCE